MSGMKFLYHFLFQTKYEQDENDIINSISYLVNNSLNERFKYEVLLKK